MLILKSEYFKTLSDFWKSGTFKGRACKAKLLCILFGFNQYGSYILQQNRKSFI